LNNQPSRLRSLAPRGRLPQNTRSKMENKAEKIRSR